MMPYNLERLTGMRLAANRCGRVFDVETLDGAIDEIQALRQALLWYVQNDETNTGDMPLPEYSGATWNQMNAYWIGGQNRARALLGLEPI